MVANPDKELRISFTIDFDHHMLRSQYASFAIDGEVFDKELADARTFCLARDVEMLRSQGLIKGGSLDSAVVIGEKGIENKEPLRYPDEFVRHKILDLLGDLTLLGMPIKGHVISIKSGHRSNVKLVREIKKVYDEMEKQKKGPVFDINAIAGMLPHRYPFLMVDHVLELDQGGGWWGSRTSPSTSRSSGPFPGPSAHPRVLIVEAFARAAFIVLRSVVTTNRSCCCFTAIDEVPTAARSCPATS